MLGGVKFVMWSVCSGRAGPAHRPARFGDKTSTAVKIPVKPASIHGVCVTILRIVSKIRHEHMNRIIRDGTRRLNRRHIPARWTGGLQLDTDAAGRLPPVMRRLLEMKSRSGFYAGAWLLTAATGLMMTQSVSLWAQLDSSANNADSSRGSGSPTAIADQANSPLQTAVQRELDAIYASKGLQAPTMTLKAATEQVKAGSAGQVSSAPVHSYTVLDRIKGSLGIKPRAATNGRRHQLAAAKSGVEHAGLQTTPAPSPYDGSPVPSVRPSDVEQKLAELYARDGRQMPSMQLKEAAPKTAAPQPQEMMAAQKRSWYQSIDLPSMPEFRRPTMPQFEMPEFDMPSLPKVSLPSVSKLPKPNFSEIEMPTLPHVSVPSISDTFEELAERVPHRSTSTRLKPAAPSSQLAGRLPRGLPQKFSPSKTKAEQKPAALPPAPQPAPSQIAKAAPTGKPIPAAAPEAKVTAPKVKAVTQVSAVDATATPTPAPAQAKKPVQVAKVELPVAQPSEPALPERAPAAEPQKLDPQMARILARGDLPGLKGLCPVTIRDERRLADASNEFKSFHDGQVYSFASAEAKLKFDQSPELYVPMAGGQDVVLLSENIQRDGSLDHAVWFRDRLYMFSTAENKAAFIQEPSSFVTAE